MNQIQSKRKKTKVIIEKRELTDLDTGEVYTLSSIIESNTKEKKQYKTNYKVPDPFVRLFHEHILDLMYSNIIDYNESSLLLHLILFVDWNSNKVIDKKGRPLSINQLSKTLKKDRTWLTTELNKLKTKGLIYLDPVGRSIVITVSPKLAWKGDIE